MRKTELFIASLFIAGLILGCAASGQQMRPAPSEELSQVPAQQQMSQQQQISAGEELSQFSIRDQQGQSIGQIDQVLVDLQQGKIGYAIVDSQQQPGQKHVIPWNALQVDPQQQVLTLQVSADQLQLAPSGDAQVVLDADQARQIDQFFGAAPAWGATQAQPEQIKGLQELQQFSIQDQQGQKLGQVSQVLVDVQRGQIGYVVVTSLQQPTQKYVIPWNALQPNPQQQTLTLPMSAQRFQQAPTGDAQMVRDMNVARQINQFYGVVPYYEIGMQQPQAFQQPRMQQPGMQQMQVRSVDTLKQFALQDQQGQRIGQIDQVLVDMQRGQIGYVAVTSQQGQKHVIPWNALRINPQQQTLTVQMSASQFQQLPSADEQMVQDMNQARQIHQFFGVAPYWEMGQQQPSQQQIQQQQMQQQYPQQR